MQTTQIDKYAQIWEDFEQVINAGLTDQKPEKIPVQEMFLARILFRPKRFFSPFGEVADDGRTQLDKDAFQVCIDEIKIVWSDEEVFLTPLDLYSMYNDIKPIIEQIAKLIKLKNMFPEKIVYKHVDFLQATKQGGHEDDHWYMAE